MLGIGALLSLAFPEPGLWWLGWAGLAPVITIISISSNRREAVTRSWLGGIGFLTALHYWVIPYTGIFTIVLSAFVGLFWIPIGLACWWALGRNSTHHRRRLAVVVIPSAWVVMEAVRSWEYLGGTWGLLGLSQWQMGLILQGAALGGVWLLTFTMVASNAALAASALPGRSRSERLGHAVIAVAIPALLAGYGAVRPEAPSEGSLRVGGVQPGVFADRADRLTAHVDETLTMEADGLDFVAWGQTSVAYDPDAEPDVDERLRSVARAIGVDLLVNIDARSGDGIVKTTVQYTSDGPVARYGKQRLVPFGEYIPLRPLLGWVADFTLAAQQDRVRGQGLKTISTAGASVGPLISYESTFPDMRRDLALLGADMVLVQGGTQTFQGTWAQPQQASYEAVNAVASGRPAVLVAVSGTSAAFDSRGRQLLWYPANRTGSFVVDVPLGSEDTAYVRFGDWVVWLSVAVLMGVLLAAAAERFTSRTSPNPGL